MPKLTPRSDDDTAGAEETSAEDAAVRKIAHELDDDEGRLTLMFRLKNQRVDYSIVNRPGPTMSGVTDALLLAALLHAGRVYAIRRRSKLSVKERSKAQRMGSGDVIVYKDEIEIDFLNKTIRSTRKKDTTLSVLSIVVQNLARGVSLKSEKDGGSKPEPN